MTPRTIRIVTPAGPGSRKGNRVSALRWARLLRELGRRVHVQQSWQGECADVLIALHASRSAGAMADFRRRCRDARLVIMLTGTDVYGDLTGAAEALRAADRIVVLQPLALRRLTPALRARGRVIYQSAAPPPTLPARSARTFDVAVLGHLREVKDPMRAAAAARGLPADSRIRVLHAGEILETRFQEDVAKEERENPRYRFLRNLPRGRALRLIARSHALVVSSLAEGGANVISEACVCGTPLLASRVDGNVGLLGEDYPGLFKPRDTAGLGRLLRRLEQDPAFARALRKHCLKLAPLFRPAREKAALRRLLAELK
jgi:putative glycosyltransferase (TIGR04348 family)